MTSERVASVDDIAVGSAIKVEISGEPIALVRTADDTVKAVHNICSHQYYDLAPEGCIGDNSHRVRAARLHLRPGHRRSRVAARRRPDPRVRLQDRRGSGLGGSDQQPNDAPIPRH